MVDSFWAWFLEIFECFLFVNEIFLLLSVVTWRPGEIPVGLGRSVPLASQQESHEQTIGSGGGLSKKFLDEAPRRHDFFMILKGKRDHLR